MRNTKKLCLWFQQKTGKRMSVTRVPSCFCERLLLGKHRSWGAPSSTAQALQERTWVHGNETGLALAAFDRRQSNETLHNQTPCGLIGRYILV